LFLEFIIDIVVLLYRLELTELLEPDPLESNPEKPDFEPELSNPEKPDFEPELSNPDFEVPSSVVWLDTAELEDKEFLLFFICKIAAAEPVDL
jgi:hypothetical protein